jgi:hypothetical protein
MTLIEDTERLAELEKQAEPNWRKGDQGNIYCVKSARHPLMMPYGVNANSDEVELIVALRNAAPKMLAALGCFQKGDAILLERIEEIIHNWEVDQGDSYSEEKKAIRRLAEAARLMEADA